MGWLNVKVSSKATHTHVFEELVGSNLKYVFNVRMHLKEPHSWVLQMSLQLAIAMKIVSYLVEFRLSYHCTLNSILLAGSNYYSLSRVTGSFKCPQT